MSRQTATIAVAGRSGLKAYYLWSGPQNDSHGRGFRACHVWFASRVLALGRAAGVARGRPLSPLVAAPSSGGSGMAEVRRRMGLAFLLILLAVGLGCAGWRWLEVRRVRRAMAEIRLEIENARFGLAARQIGSLLAWKPDSDEAIYLLGLCERERGQADQASRTWRASRLAQPFGRQAIQGRLELESQRGRFAEAEELITSMATDPGIDEADLSLLLGPLYCEQGRLADALRAVEARWRRLDSRGEGASEQAVNLVRLHVSLEENTPPINSIRAALDAAARRARPMIGSGWAGPTWPSAPARSKRPEGSWMRA